MILSGGGIKITATILTFVTDDFILAGLQHCPRSLHWVHRVPKQTIHITLIIEPKCHTALYPL